METIEQLLSLSITDLKQLGFAQPDAYKYGAIEWTRGGRNVASIAIATDTRGEIPTVRFVYNYNGSPVDYTAPLRFTPSNLNRGGYYYFVCPVTGRACRKLYIVGGRFVSRFAFRALYEQQTKSRRERSGVFAYFDALKDYDDILGQANRKPLYRGELTPYGRRVERLAAKFERAYKSFEAAEKAEQAKFAKRYGKIADIRAFLD